MPRKLLGLVAQDFDTPRAFYRAMRSSFPMIKISYYSRSDDDISLKRTIPSLYKRIRNLFFNSHWNVADGSVARKVYHLLDAHSMIRIGVTEDDEDVILRSINHELKQAHDAKKKNAIAIG